MTVETTAVQTMQVSDARRLTERIRLTAHAARESIEKLQSLVNEARDGNVHLTLGYPSWTAYLADVMGEEPLRLPRDQRREVVLMLAGEGMSTRAIERVTGASHGTVVSDLSQVVRNDHLVSPEPSLSPLVNTVTGEVSEGYLSDDGSGEEVTSPEGEKPPQAPSVPASVERVPTPRPPVTSVEDAVDGLRKVMVDNPMPEKTKGLDGKSYARKAQTGSRRKPLPDSFWTAAFDLGKRVESIRRLIDDDRFPQNAEKVAAAHRNDLLHYRDLLQEVIDRLPQA